MSNGDSGETKQEVVEGAGISDRRLKSWRAASLIPTPELRSQGHARGMKAVYPPGTTELARRIKEKLERVPTLADAAWWIWCEGYDPYTELVRGILRRGIGEAKAHLQQGLENFLDDDPDNPIQKATEERLDWGVGWLRDRVGREEFSTDAYYVTAGLAEQLDEGDFLEGVPDVLMKSMRLIFDRMGVGELIDELTPNDVQRDLLKSFSVINAPRAVEWLDTASDDELRAVRREAVACFREWAPDRAQEEPVPIWLFINAYLFRESFPDSPHDQLFRKSVNFLTSLDDPVAQQFGEMLRDSSLHHDPSKTMSL